MEESETHHHKQTWERKQRRNIKISPNKTDPDQCRWVSIGEILKNRINYHVVSQEFFNIHQYGFTSQKGTIDADMDIKEFVKEGLAAGEIIVLISLDVKCAFHAAWWPSILNGLRDIGWPNKSV